MQAMVYQEYGPPAVVKLETVDEPVPADDEVLIRVQAASVNAADWRLMRGKPLVYRLVSGIRRPRNRILGADVAGRVIAVGRHVTQFQPGDAVYGDLSGCGFGGFAEFVTAPAAVLAPMPAGLTFAQAAAVPMAGVTALQALRNKGQIQAGQHVLIVGASGGVGTFAVQLARDFGADVTAVCSLAKMDLARSLGASQVIDYTREDFTATGRRYDLIMAANGAYPLAAFKRALAPNGICVVTGGAMRQLFAAILLGPLLSSGGQTLGAMEARPDADDLSYMNALLESGRVAPVIDRQFSLAEVPAALAYLEAGHARGKVVITVADGQET